MRIVLCGAAHGQGYTETYVAKNGEQVQVICDVADKKADLVVDVHKQSGLSRFYPKKRRVFATFESPLHLSTWLDPFCASPRNVESYYGTILSTAHRFELCKHVVPHMLAEIWVTPRPAGDVKHFGVGGCFSAKRGFAGYELRHEIIEAQGELDLPHMILDSRGLDTSPWKPSHVHSHASREECFNFQFYFAIENFAAPGYFTEKLLDCFAARVVPLYFGAPDLGRWFNLDGVIRLDRKNWRDQVHCLTPKDYTDRLAAVDDNYTRSIPWWSHARSVLAGLALAKLVPQIEFPARREQPTNFAADRMALPPKPAPAAAPKQWDCVLVERDGRRFNARLVERGAKFCKVVADFPGSQPTVTVYGQKNPGKPYIEWPANTPPPSLPDRSVRPTEVR